MRRVMIYITVLTSRPFIGTVTRPDGWYTALAKPSFNPPNCAVASALDAPIAAPNRPHRHNRTGPGAYPQGDAGMLSFR